MRRRCNWQRRRQENTPMLYLFDLDGTLISSYMDNPDRNFHTWHPLPGREHTIARLRHLGHDVALVSNQAGVAFGLTTEQDVIKKFGRVAMVFGFASIWIHDGGEPMHAGWDAPALDCFVCYNDARSKNMQYQDARRRKPSGSMIREAMAVVGLSDDDTDDRGKVIYVGDRAEDEAAARDAGVRFVWAEEFFDGR
jgi:D-glycero-D-manno-heptose 1,7-bisphosphate phosphatase